MSFTLLRPGDLNDYLHTGTQIKFDKNTYSLAWSANAAPGRFMQEYIRQGEKVESFKKMMIIQAVESNMSLKEAVDAKVSELHNRKKWDFVANYQVYENPDKPDEGLIDFVVSDTMINYEWNLYRYQLQKGKDNKHYVVLLAYSNHEIVNDNADLKKFFNHIKSQRTDLINELIAYDFSKVLIAP